MGMDRDGVSKAIDKVLTFRDVQGRLLEHDDIKIKEEKIFTVLMMGPRRCGKTSVLTSISKCIKDATSGGSITCVPRSENYQFFLQKTDNLREFAENPANHLEGKTGNTGIDATSEISSYDFVMYHIKSKKNMYMLRFIDANGEFYRDYPKEMSRLVKECDMIMIAIDTPALGIDNQSLSHNMNGYDYINGYFSELDIDEELMRAKLVLFVPIKCEYLYRRDEDNNSNTFMNSVVEGIKKYYSQTINRLSNDDFKKYISMAITPVLTIGGVKFISYETDDSGEYRKDDNGLALANYIKDTQHPGYNPKYCEQPVYYLLTFMYNLVVETKANSESDVSKFFKKIPLLRKLMVDKDTNLLNELKKVAAEIVYDEKGFVILEDEKRRLKKNDVQ